MPINLQNLQIATENNNYQETLNTEDHLIVERNQLELSGSVPTLRDSVGNVILYEHPEDSSQNKEDYNQYIGFHLLRKKYNLSETLKAISLNITELRKQKTLQELIDQFFSTYNRVREEIPNFGVTGSIESLVNQKEPIGFVNINDFNDVQTQLTDALITNAGQLALIQELEDTIASLGGGTGSGDGDSDSGGGGTSIAPAGGDFTDNEIDLSGQADIVSTAGLINGVFHTRLIGKHTLFLPGVGFVETADSDVIDKISLIITEIVDGAFVYVDVLEPDTATTSTNFTFSSDKVLVTEFSNVILASVTIIHENGFNKTLPTQYRVQYFLPFSNTSGICIFNVNG